MPPSPDASQKNPVPLVVDLDGTLIKTDLLWESLARLLRRNPFWIFPVLFWWLRGRAFLKKNLAARVAIDPATLPYNESLLAWLHEQKSGGRKLILATASDLQMALPVAHHVGIFDEVLGSDGRQNLRGDNKLKALVAKFGERGFDYAGNSAPDLAVWRGAREAIVVNASRALANRAARCATLGPAFIENYSPLATLKSVLNELFIRSGYLVAVLAGLLLAAAFPKVGIAGFAWIAPALLVFAAQNKSGGDAFRAGYLGGFSFWLAALYWLLLIPYRWHSLPLGPALGWLALSAYLALYFAVWLWLLSRFTFHVSRSWLHRTIWSLAGAAIWVGLEMIRARLLGGFPWNFIGGSQCKLVPLIQIAAVTGVYDVSFLVVWTSLSLFSAARVIVSKPAARLEWLAEIFLPLAAVTILFVFGLARINSENPPAATLRATLVQPGIPQTLIWDESQNAMRFQQLLALSENALSNKTDLLIWPESAVPEFDDATYAAITNFVRAHRVWLIFNADDNLPKANPTPEDEFDSYNAAFCFDPNGQCEGIYHKRKLVIFGEYVPLTHWLPFLKWFTPITGSYEAGNAPVIFELGRQIKTAPLICFEDTFPQMARASATNGVEFLVNLTNDGWFGDSAEQWQHAANAIFRAVENGVPLVRDCNNGVTCWIDGNGRVRKIFRDKTGSVYGAGAMTIEVPLQKRAPTFYNRHGDWFGWGCVALMAVIAVGKLFSGKSRQTV
jgi:apolipoprotein N-acyltransferase